MSIPNNEDSETPPVKRKRKSRWGSEDDKVQLPIPPVVIPNEINAQDPDTPSLSGTYACVLLQSVYVDMHSFVFILVGHEWS